MRSDLCSNNSSAVRSLKRPKASMWTAGWKGPTPVDSIANYCPPSAELSAGRRLRAEWTANGVTDRFFDYAQKGTRPASPDQFGG